MITDDLLGIPGLPLEEDALKQASQDIAQRLKASGYNIHDPRDDRDAILTHEIEHIE